MNETKVITGAKWIVPLACLLVVGALIGLSVNLAKYSAGIGLNPLTLLTWSTTGAAAVLSLIGAAAGRPPRYNRPAAIYLAISALVSVAAPNLILYAAAPMVGAGFVALTIAFPPLMTYLGALAMRLERLSAARATGVALALLGAGWIALLKLSAPDAPVIWIAATLTVPAVLAVGNIYRTVKWPEGLSPAELAPGLMSASAAMLLLVGLTPAFPLAVPLDSPLPLALIVAQAAAFSLQYVLYFVLQKQGGPVYLSLLGSVAAVVGVPVAMWLLNESPPQGLALGGIAIAAGIWLLTAGIPREKGRPLSS